MPAMLGWLREAKHLRLALEPGEPLRIARKYLRQDLQRDIAVELGVARSIHLAHTAGAKSASDFVRAETGPRNQRHGVRAR
jgi:hypothetical protein